VAGGGRGDQTAVDLVVQPARHLVQPGGNGSAADAIDGRGRGMQGASGCVQPRRGPEWRIAIGQGGSLVKQKQGQPMAAGKACATARTGYIQMGQDNRGQSGGPLPFVEGGPEEAGVGVGHAAMCLHLAAAGQRIGGAPRPVVRGHSLDQPPRQRLRFSILNRHATHYYAVNAAGVVSYAILIKGLCNSDLNRRY